MLPQAPKASALPDELNGENGGRGWIRTSVQLRADLQSATFDLSVTRPKNGSPGWSRTNDISINSAALYL